MGSHLTTTRPVGPASGLATPVHTVRLSSWLRDFLAPQVGPRVPVVMRVDIEGVEYDMLSDLATSGVGRELDLYLTLEWHRGSKEQFYAAELPHMRMLDARFARYPNRCYDGSCNLTVGDRSVLMDSLEKTLAFMLHRAGITYVDAYFDVPANGKGGKTPSEQAWSRTRERRAALEH